MAGHLLQKECNAVVSYAADGQKALLQATETLQDLVVTDLHMPEMDGLQLVEELKSRFPDLPVILMTGFGNEQIAVEALRKGAASYVPKKHLKTELSRTVGDLLMMARGRRKRQRMLGCITRSETQFVLENDTSLAEPLIGFVQETLVRSNLFDESAAMHFAVALHESITNAINHGNLEVSSDLRQQDERIFEEAVRARRREEPYSRRRVHVLVSIAPDDGARIVIRDEGPGFDVAKVLDPTEDVNLDRIGGRGLLLIRTFMDEVQHNASGNEITLVKRAIRPQPEDHPAVHELMTALESPLQAVSAKP
jgi:CheY-like chemotaxis protein